MAVANTPLLDGAAELRATWLTGESIVSLACAEWVRWQVPLKVCAHRASTQRFPGCEPGVGDGMNPELERFAGAGCIDNRRGALPDGWDDSTGGGWSEIVRRRSDS